MKRDCHAHRNGDAPSRCGGLLKRRLFWRIYMHSVGLLVIVAAVIALTVALNDSHQSPFSGVFHRTQTHADDPARLQLWLDDLSATLKSNAAIFDAEGTIIMWSGADQPTLDREEMKEFGRGKHVHSWSEHRLVGCLDDGRFLVVKHPHKKPRIVWKIGVLVILLALVSWPLARAIARPIEALTRVAQALGAGDLSVRTGFAGKGELGQLAGSFDEMASRLQLQVENQRALLVAVSHELRTPLARVRVALELLEATDDTELQLIEADLDELDTLIGDLLTAGRLDDTGFVLRRSRVDLSRLAQRSTKRFSTLFPDLTLTAEVAPQTHIEADEGLIRRLVDNLLDNAARYGNGRVWLRIFSADGAVTIEVEDDGASLTTDQLAHLFQPFYRTDASRQRSTGGVGLGLTLCRRIAHAHGATLTPSLREGGGLLMRLVV